MHEFRKYISKKFEFTSSEIEAIVTCFEIRKLKKQEYFLTEGQFCKSIAFVEEGGFLYYQNIEGDEKACDFTFENDWITPFESLQNNTPSPVNIRALENAKILVLNMQKLEKLSEGLPKVLTIKTILTDAYFADVKKREVSLASLKVEELYQQLIVDFPDIHKRVQQYHIASYLGIKPQALSKIRSTS